VGENAWADVLHTLTALGGLTDGLLDDLDGMRDSLNLPDDPLSAEVVVIEALIAYHDAQNAVAIAAERYRNTQRNWARVRLPLLKAEQEKAEAANKTAETANPQPGEQQTGDAHSGLGAR
jgi:hypothetical protein